MTTVLSKQDRVFNYFVSGKTLSQDSALAMFGVANLRATVSDIKELASDFGYSVFRTVGRHGETRYGLTKKRSHR